MDMTGNRGYNFLGIVLLAIPLSCTPQKQEAQTNQTTQQISQTNFFETGFTIRTSEDCKLDSTEPSCRLELSKGTALENNEKSKDLKRKGWYIVFTWPESIPSRDYDALALQMRQYATGVGSILKRDPVGPGEKLWWETIRRKQTMAYSSLATTANGGAKFCGAVVDNLVNTLLPEGSTYRQYGNCGEGGVIGMCLALKAGFKEEEIRICESRNDHMFAMVRDYRPKGKWCLLDRWQNQQDTMPCGVDWDSKTREVGPLPNPTDRTWFQRIHCQTMKEFFARGGHTETYENY